CRITHDARERGKQRWPTSGGSDRSRRLQDSSATEPIAGDTLVEQVTVRAPTPRAAVHVEQAQVVPLQAPTRPTTLLGMAEIPGVLRQQFFGAPVVTGGHGAGAAAILPFGFRRQAIARALEIVGSELHPHGVLSEVRQVAPLGFGDAFLFAQPVAVFDRLIPGDADDRAIRIGGTAHLVMGELGVEAFELLDGYMV